MSERYSLRQTPKYKSPLDLDIIEILTCTHRKTQHLGLVQTPGTRKPYRRKSQFTEDLLEDDNSSATDSSSKPNGTMPKRRVIVVEDAMNGDVMGDASTEYMANGNGKLMNGTTNGSANGHTNGHANGHTNGHANGHTNGYANGHTNGKANGNGKRMELVVDGWSEGMDPKIDYSPHYDFGGSPGVTVMMICFPLLMYYMWIGATFYDGKFPTPEPGQSFGQFLQRMAHLVYTEAFPSVRAWTIYWTFFVFEGACYCLMPGIYQYGKPLPHMGGKQLLYYCSGIWSFWFTIVVAATLHFLDIFKLYTIIDEFGPILSVAICSGYIVSVIAYVSAIARGAQHRMTGSFLYDFFMGAELNPRMFGVLDFKMFFEVRLPWYILLGLSCGTAARQWEEYGYVSAEVCFLVMAHFLYANACSKGEELITTTW
jgi:delta24(24(1))-sterol reductase